MDANPPESSASVSASVAQLQERLDRMLLLYAESVRTQSLLDERLRHTEAERDQLRHRVQEATGRIDDLLRRLDQTDAIPGTPDQPS